MNPITALPLSADMIAWLADKITASSGNDHSRTAVVFNGKRPALYLNRQIAKILDSSFFPPKYFSIDEFITTIVEKHESRANLTEIEAAHRIYKICQDSAPSLLHNREKFSQFLPWAKEILRFISLCDKENTSDDMLANMGRNAELGLDVPQAINDILRHLKIVRERFHKSLEERGQATSSYQYLQAARLAEKTSFSEFDSIIFAGFHYFHNTERAVASALLRRGLARLVFFGSQDDWPLLAQNAAAFGSAIHPQKDTATQTIKFYAARDIHSQAALARQILAEIPDQSNTLVLLPDGSALVPALSEISQAAEKLNVSLGYAIRKSALYSLISAIIEAQATRANMVITQETTLRFLPTP